MLEKKAEDLAAKNQCRFLDNETPYERVPKGTSDNRELFLS